MAIKKNKLLNVLVSQLAEQGQQVINKAYENRGSQPWYDQLYNLHDSYGSAVYVNGVLQPNTIRYVNGGIKSLGDANKYRDNEVRGRDAINRFFNEYQANSGVELVVVAAMFYAGILENGGGGIKHKYKVISGGRDAMDNIVKQYKGCTLYRIDYLMNKTRLA